jgi:septum formation protein
MADPDSAGIGPPSGPPLILASGSPRRRELLGRLGIPFQVVVSHSAESIAPDLGPEAQAMSLAEQKARAVASGIETGVVLGADTIVVLNGMLLGKPEDDADAIDMLRLLSGRAHRVVTGIAVIDAASSLRSSAVSSVVHFRTLSDDDVAAYVATGEPRDKAGAYAIQGLGAALVSDLEGCFNNVVGLPLCETASLLREAGFVISATWPGCHLPDGTRCPRQV